MMTMMIMNVKIMIKQEAATWWRCDVTHQPLLLLLALPLYILKGHVEGPVDLLQKGVGGGGEEGEGQQGDVTSTGYAPRVSPGTCAAST